MCALLGFSVHAHVRAIYDACRSFAPGLFAQQSLLSGLKGGGTAAFLVSPSLLAVDLLVQTDPASTSANFGIQASCPVLVRKHDKDQQMSHCPAVSTNRHLSLPLAPHKLKAEITHNCHKASPRTHGTHYSDVPKEKN